MPLARASPRSTMPVLPPPSEAGDTETGQGPVSHWTQPTSFKSFSHNFLKPLIMTAGYR